VSQDVLITGGTGYMGSRLTSALLGRGHRVRVLTRPASTVRVPPGAAAIPGDALDPASVAAALRPADVLVHLVGTPHPGPSKAEEFRRVDLPSIAASVDAVRRVGAQQLVYVSVAQPAPVMKAYVAVRAAGEQLIRDAKLTATILRPWYVLGPGHRWPLLLLPVYGLAGLIPAVRDGARRLGLVTLSQMTAALVHAVENSPARGMVRIVGVPEIRASQ
jgi:uncharacterized protein YbjT (DUF2867 family)